MPPRYRHYKGGEYEIITFARHSETQERMMVYRSVETGHAWVRPLDMFHGRLPDGRRRFEPINVALDDHLGIDQPDELPSNN